MSADLVRAATCPSVQQLDNHGRDSVRRNALLVILFCNFVGR